GGKAVRPAAVGLDGVAFIHRPVAFETAVPKLPWKPSHQRRVLRGAMPQAGNVPGPGADLGRRLVSHLNVWPSSTVSGSNVTTSKGRRADRNRVPAGG